MYPTFLRVSFCLCLVVLCVGCSPAQHVPALTWSTASKSSMFLRELFALQSVPVLHVCCAHTAAVSCFVSVDSYTSICCCGLLSAALYCGTFCCDVYAASVLAALWCNLCLLHYVAAWCFCCTNLQQVLWFCLWHVFKKWSTVSSAYTRNSQLRC